eukprot:CAMPEP_0176476014 /NCGR_PEP_ID=MMETSP0127-20121128/43917_1 /TAXON_ID=938130 /ORGANISM="Platyophrya macrostoma, Strain WH" /LENGTH=95 /DNA_ID=CAMNT_0017871655 /DNA_START=673 /DNA_END=960 /DNA_ORIENTATION=+
MTAQRYQTESRVATYSWLALLFILVQLPVIYAITKVEVIQQFLGTRDIDLRIPLLFGLGGGVAVLIVSKMFLILFSSRLPSYGPAGEAPSKLKTE